MRTQNSAEGIAFDRGVDRAAWILLLLAAVLLGICVADAGITFDEPECAANGRRILHCWTQGAEYDARAADLMRFYGGAFDLPCAVLERVSPCAPHDTRHAFNALMALLLALGTWLLARTAGGSLTGLAALILLLATPGFWAHAANNPKDIPFAAGTAWSLLLLLRAVPHFPQLGVKHALALGAVLGWTCGVRIGGLLHVGLAALVLLLCTAAEWRSSGARRATLLAALRTALLLAVSFAAVLFAVWPWIWSAPIDRMIEAVHTMAHFPWPDTLLFEGRALRLDELPRTYLPVMLTATAPLGLALVWCLGVACAGWTRARLAALLCLLMVLIPVGSILLGHGQLYDGLRHLLFVLPALATVAGLGVHCCAQRLKGRLKASLLVIALAASLLHVPVLIRLHPYEVAWFSGAVNGLVGAEGRFDHDYWLASCREAAEWLERHAADPSTLHSDGRHRVKVALRSATVAPFLPASRFTLVDHGADADWFIAATRWNADQRHAGTTVHRIERQGVVFCVVKDLRRGPENK